MLCQLSTTSRGVKLFGKTWSRCIQIRRSKKKWVTAESGALKNDPTRLALNQFDKHYGAQFSKDWPSMRLALLSLQKYGALINGFCDSDNVIEQLSTSMGASDFIQTASEQLRAYYSAKEVDAMEQRIRKIEQKVDDNDESNYVDEYADECGSDVEMGDHEISKTLQEPRGEMGKGLTAESGVAYNPIRGEINGRMKGQVSKGDSWRDKYIVAAGFESKLEYMIGQEEVMERTVSFDDTSIYPEMTQVPINISPSLRCLTFSEGKFQRFPPAKVDSVSGLLFYYTMDASSLLPVIALDIQPSDAILDMCAAPGGKSLAMLNVLGQGGIVLNEPSSPRRKRLLSVLKAYIPQEVLNSGVLQVTSVEGEKMGASAPDTFDKVLVDVPCTTDRLSLKEKENNIFTGRRNKERWELPSLQEKLLCSALLSVKPGGDVVYATCSLSSLQNDGVVHGAILTCQEEYDMSIQVVDLSPLASCTNSVFRFSNTARYGQLVVPELDRNFGPMYFARLRKL